MVFGIIINIPEIFVYSVLGADEQSSSTKSSSSSNEDSDNKDDNESPHTIKVPKNKDKSTHSKKPTESCKGISCSAGDEHSMSQQEANDLKTIKDVPTNEHTRNKQNNDEENYPHYKDTKTPTIAQDLNTDSRDELLDKVTTPKELLNILTKFRSFMDNDTSAITQATSSISAGKVNTTPTRSYVISYSWEPAEKITKEKYSILMLKFTDTLGNIIRNKDIDYNIMIRDNNSNIIFQKQGSTPTGVDLKVINENTFPIGGSLLNPKMYNIQIDVNGIDGKLISEHALLPSVAVVSEKA